MLETVCGAVRRLSKVEIVKNLELHLSMRSLSIIISLTLGSCVLSISSFAFLPSVVLGFRCLSVLMVRSHAFCL